MKHALVVATGNKGKFAEVRELLADLPVDVFAPGDLFREAPNVVEDGVTFVANATKKARAYAERSLMLSLGDDSGLEVDVLGGAPGVRSARYAHEHATDGENRTALIAALDALSPRDAVEIRSAHAGQSMPAGPPPFTARFRCALVLIDPFAPNDSAVSVAEGTVEGSIVRTPRGTSGFGYDPLFVVDGTSKTMAELSSDEKNRVSHRGRAMVAMRQHIVAALEARTARMRRLYSTG